MIIIIIITEINKQQIMKNRLWWWDSNPEHVYDFYEQEDIKLIKTDRNQKNPRDSLFKAVAAP